MCLPKLIRDEGEVRGNKWGEQRSLTYDFPQKLVKANGTNNEA